MTSLVGATMRTLLAAMELLSAGPCRSAATQPPSLLYATEAAWEAVDRPAKLAMARDFMRIFCGDPRMPPARLVICLDEKWTAGPFRQALLCVERITGDAVIHSR